MRTQTLGIHYLLDGFKLIFQPGLKRYVFIPIAINVCLFIGLFFVLHHFIDKFNLWFDHFLPSWLQWLSIVIWLLFFASFFLIFIYTFVTIANLISAPFNSFLAEKVQLRLIGVVAEKRSLQQNIKDVPRIIKRQLSILVYYVPRAVAILVLFFIPGLQIFAPFLWFFFNAWFMALTYIDYPTDNQGVAIDNAHAWLQQRRLTALGFGSAVLVASMLPIVNFFIVAAAVAGATKFWVEENLQ